MVVFVNKLVLTGAAQELEERYARVAAFMRTQPGLVRYQLLRSQKDPAVYYNVAEWTDKASLDSAMRDPEFRRLLAPVLELITGEPHVADVVLAGEPAPISSR